MRRCNHAIYTKSYRFKSESKNFYTGGEFEMQIEPIYLAGLTEEEVDRLTPLPYPTEEEIWLWH